jgi:hypothetical protein
MRRTENQRRLRFTASATCEGFGGGDNVADGIALGGALPCGLFTLGTPHILISTSSTANTDSMSCMSLTLVFIANAVAM